MKKIDSQEASLAPLIRIPASQILSQNKYFSYWCWPVDAEWKKDGAIGGIPPWPDLFGKRSCSSSK